MDTDIFTAYIKTENSYVGIAKDVEKRFDTSNFELEDLYLQEKLKSFWIN